MVDSAFDCYLCGTTNPLEADHCTSCSGQLLRLPGDDAESDDPDELGDSANFDDPTPEPAPAPQKKSKLSPMQRRLQSSVLSSVEDQRLSDALGLSKQSEESSSDDDIDDGLDQLHTEVTSIPQTKAAENIPVIGTQGSSAIHYKDDDEVGPIAYVITALLIVATIWFGYDSLFRDRGPQPDSIAFTDTTRTSTSTSSTTSTQAPETTVPIDEVDFRFGPTIVLAVPFDCDISDDPVADPLVAVAIDEHSVVLGNNLPAGVDAVQIVTRTGNIRVGVVHNRGGINLASSNAPTSRHLSLDEVDYPVSSVQPAYFVGYDAEANLVYTTEASQSFDAEIAVSDKGEAIDIRIGGNSFAAEDLASIDITVELDGDPPGQRARVCDTAEVLVPVTPVAQSLEAAGVDADGVENDTGADLEETDAG